MRKSARKRQLPPETHSSALPLLCLCAAVAFSTAIAGQFTWIDHVEIEQGGYRLTGPGDFERLWTLSLEEYIERHAERGELAGGYYRPVYALSITADWWLWRDRAWLYHVENIAWHCLVVCLLYTLGRLLLASTGHGDKAAFWSALLFAVNPLGVHSVTWISGRKDTMCAAFGLLALLIFLRICSPSIDKQQSQRTTSLRWLLVPFFLALSIFSKELGFVVPVFASLWWLTRLREPGQQVVLMQGVPPLVSMWLVVVGVLGFRQFGLGGMGLDAQHPSDSFLNNVATYATLWVSYATRVFFTLSPTIADRWPVARELGLWETAALAALAAATLATIWGLWRRSMSALLTAWFGIWMLPASGLMPLRHLYAERYLYPASWGLIAMAVLLVFAIPRKGIWSTGMRTTTLSLYVIVLGTATLIANRHWQDDESLFRHATAQDPKYAEGLSGLASISLTNEKYKEAVAFAERAIQSGNDRQHASYWSPFITYTTLGLAQYNLGDGEAATAAFQNAIDSHPGNAIGHYHLGLARQAVGDLAGAEKSFRQALTLQPTDFLSASNLGYVLLQTSQFEACIAILQPLAADHPNDVTNSANLGTAFLMSGDFSSAEIQFKNLVDATEDAANLAKLAWAEWKLGKKSAAKDHWIKANRLRPDHPTVRFVAQMMAEE